ncbi:MAG: MBL fold metallo-hydrolase [Oscillospiraceae bacterium]
MYVKIHRGSAQIGGNLVEVGTAKTRLMFDAGANLPPLDGSAPTKEPEIEGLTAGVPAFDGVFLSHHHGDHCGLAHRILPKIPLFAGRETGRILDVIADFTDTAHPPISGYITAGVPLTVGNLTVTPVAVDHSAKDAYLFAIQGEGKTVIYTGDYREGGGLAADIVRKFGKIDAVISEGTNIAPGRNPVDRPRTEAEVAVCAEDLMKHHSGTVFVLCSSTNAGRVEAIYRAAEGAGRTCWEDVFMSSITEKGSEGNTFVAFWMGDSAPAAPYFSKLYEERQMVGAAVLGRLPGKKVIFIRPTMLPFLRRYLESAGLGDHALLYSVWGGYRATEPYKSLLSFCENMGITLENLHVSGHACRAQLVDFLSGLNAETIIPIHCMPEDRPQFAALFPACRFVADGERLDIEG